jgi:hypothetical protein
MTSQADTRPFSALSKNPEHPHSAWEEPEPTTFNPLGRLALITPELVKRAASEIRTGERFSLDLSIESEGFTLFGRKKAERTVKRIDKCAKTKEETEKNGELWFPKHDDLIHINTQVSSSSGDSKQQLASRDSKNQNCISLFLIELTIFRTLPPLS